MRIDFATLPATTFVYSEFLWIAIVVCLRRWLAGRLYRVCCMFLTNAAYEVTWFEVVLISSTVYLGWQLIVRATSSNWDLSLKSLSNRNWFLWWDSSLWKSIALTKILSSIWKNPTHDFLYLKTLVWLNLKWIELQWVYSQPHYVKMFGFLGWNLAKAWKQRWL